MKMRSNGTANVKSSGGSLKLYTNKLISTSDWVEDATYLDYPFKADVECQSITTNDFVEVDLDFLNTPLSRIVTTSTDKVTFYASKIPSEDILINSITASEIGYSEIGFTVLASDENAEGKTITATKIG